MIEDSNIVADDLWLDRDGDLWRIAADRTRMHPIKISGIPYPPDPNRSTSVRHIDNSVDWTRIGPDRRREIHFVPVERRDNPRLPRLWMSGADDTEVGRAKLSEPVPEPPRAGALSAAVGEDESLDRQHLADLRMAGPDVRDAHLKSTHGLDSEVIDVSFAAVHRLLHEVVSPAEPRTGTPEVHREQHLALYVNDDDGLERHLTRVHGDLTSLTSHSNALRWHSRLHTHDDGMVTAHHNLSGEPAVDANAVEQPEAGVDAAQIGQRWRADFDPIEGVITQVRRHPMIGQVTVIRLDTTGEGDETEVLTLPGVAFTLIADVEPEYEPGSMWVDADNRRWVRAVNNAWWIVGYDKPPTITPAEDGNRRPGDWAAHDIPTRPLTPVPWS